MKPQDNRHPLNAPGPFYVAKDECMACHAPEAEAPELMSFDDASGSCYFHRQPVTPEELTHATMAVWASCCSAVTYSGGDPQVLTQLRRLNGGSSKPASWWQFWKR
jgi:ferredoxin